MKGNIIIFSEKNIGWYLHDLGVGKEIYSKLQKMQIVIRNVEKLDNGKSKNICSSKGNIKKVKVKTWS